MACADAEQIIETTSIMAMAKLTVLLKFIFFIT